MSSFNNSRILIKFCYFSRAAQLFTSSRALDHFRLGEGGRVVLRTILSVDSFAKC